MNAIELDAAELDAINPEHLLLAQWAGGNDVLTQSGSDLLTHNGVRQDMQQPNATLSEVLKWLLNETSGNSYDVVVWLDGTFRKADITSLWA